MLLLWTSVDTAEAQPPTQPEAFALNQPGFDLAGFNGTDDVPELTEEQQLLIAALFADNPEIYETGEAQAAVNATDLAGLFNVLEGILVDVLCTVVCDEADTDLERVEQILTLMESQYTNENIKYFGYLSAEVNVAVATGTFTLYFDMMDILAITEEGADQYVTVWLNLGASAGLSVSIGDLLPVGAGVVPFVRQPGLDDPQNSWSVSALSGSLPFYACSGLSFGSEGDVEAGCEEDQQVPLSLIDVSLIDIEINLARFEVRKSYLQRAMTDFVTSLRAGLQPVDDITEIPGVTRAFLGYLFNYGLNYAALALIPQEGEIRAFTCLDDGTPCGLSGVINIVSGCRDVDRDGIGDNVC